MCNRRDRALHLRRCGGNLSIPSLQNPKKSLYYNKAGEIPRKKIVRKPRNHELMERKEKLNLSHGFSTSTK